MELIIKLKEKIENVIEDEELNKKRFKSNLNKALKEEYISGFKRALKELKELCDEN